MDGVPVKISEKYKPRKKISLPGSVLNKIQLLKENHTEEYDFSFEKSVLDQISKIREFKKISEEKKKKIKEEELQKLEEGVEKMSVEVSPETPSSPPISQEVSPITVSTSPVQNSSQTTILTPIPVSVTSDINVTRYVDNSILTEFESDTSSPFDNMELKSINDLKELADVLGTGNNVCSKEQSNIPVNGISSHWNNNANPNIYKYQSPHQYYTNIYNPVSSGSVYGSYTVNSSVMPSGLSSSTITMCSPQHTFSTLNSGISPPSYVPQYITTPSQTPPPVPPKPPSMSSHQVPYKSYPSTSLYQQPVQSSHILRPFQDCSKPSVDPAEMNLWTGLHNSILERRTSNLNKPNPLPTSLPSTSPHTVEETESRSEETSLPNPMNSLNPEGQMLARKLSEMGFPLARAARAVELFHNDEAKVIEFLLQVQKFEDCQVPGDQAETALIVNNFNEKETLTYLQNIKKLTDFGFEEKKVIEALSKCNNDTDKALDFLIA